MKRIIFTTIVVFFLTGGIAFAQTTGYKVQFTHGGESDLAEFKLYHTDTSGGPYTFNHTILIADYLPPPAFMDVNVPMAEGTWYFVVVAFDESGNNSPNSDEGTLVVGDSTPPGQCSMPVLELP